MSQVATQPETHPQISQSVLDLEGRRAEMVRSIDHLIHVHDDWESDPEASHLPTVALEEAIELATGICCNGSIPVECQELYNSVSVLAVEWQAYRDGSKINRDGRPESSLWDAYRRVLRARAGTIVIKPRALESVKQLVAEKVPGLQIAKIYGQRIPGANPLEGPQWRGVFFDEFGRVRHDLLAQEAENPGSVVPADWVHPDEVSRYESEREAMVTRLDAINAAESEPDGPYEDPATIEQLLREGQFPATIAKVKNTTIDAVLAVAAEMGIDTNDPNSPELWVKPDNEPDDETNSAPGANTVATVDPNGLDLQSEQPASDVAAQDDVADDAKLESRVIDIYQQQGDTISSPEIAEIINAEFGTNWTGRKMTRIINRYRRSIE